jgi:mono/diheme cytochrome c family protein
MVFRALTAVGLVALASLHLSAQTTPAAGGSRSAPELYKQNCLVCHMADGNAALEPMNFADGKWRHGTRVKELAEVISEGVPGTAMMPFKTRFSQAEIVALAKYVRTFDKSLKAAPAAKKKAAAK